MTVQEFFHRSTGTLTYVVHDDTDAVVIDPCLDFDFSEMTVGRGAIDPVVAYLKTHQLRLHWILETHVHADHVTGAQVVKAEFPDANLAISQHVCEVQTRLKDLFGLKMDAFPDGWPFDRLLKDGDVVQAGKLRFEVMETPGHTPACVCFKTDAGVFTGDVLFSPTAGTGRCDFPGAAAATLFQSVQKIYALKDSTVLFFGHSYPGPEQPPLFRGTVLDERHSNTHLRQETTAAEFIRFREARDKTLALPKLFYPSLFLNIRGGILPEADARGRRYFRFPILASL